MPIGFVKLPVTLWGLELGLPPLAVATAVLAMALAFLAFYVIPAIRVIVTLGRVARRLKTVPAGSALPGVDHIFFRHRLLRHLWSEYRDTLHRQTDGAVRLRATVPAEMFFTAQVVVDTPLRSEFFRHLPGLLTGVGIIGTFFGLIAGLQQFNMRLDPQALSLGLEHLIGSVKEAFIASCLAISTAMVVTLVEKLLLTWAYHRLQRLVQAIDALYDAGAGEDYLARLVAAAEDHGAHIDRLGDRLIAGLTPVLTALAERQIAASAGIATSLAEPLDRLARTAEQGGGQQSEAVQAMLDSLLTAFMSRLDASLGTSIGQNANNMRDVQTGFQALLQDLAQAEDSATRGMAEQMVRMMAETEAQQQQMSLQVARGAQELQTQLTGSVQGIRTAVADMMTELAVQRRRMVDSNGEDLTQMRASVAEILEAVRKAGRQMADQYGADISNALDKVRGGLDTALQALMARQYEIDARNLKLVEQLNQRLDLLGGAGKEVAEEMRDTTRRLTDATRRLDAAADKIKA